MITIIRRSKLKKERKDALAVWDAYRRSLQTISELVGIPGEIKCVVQVHRMGPTVSFGPFKNDDAARDWCNERNVRGMIVGMYEPSTDTGPFGMCWQ